LLVRAQVRIKLLTYRKQVARQEKLIMTRRSFGYIRRLPSKRYQASYNGPDLARHAAPDTFEGRLDAEG
jgi:hypothetical protein